MKKVLLAFGVHNHQPVGNFDSVFESTYQQCYLPYLELLTRHPEFRSSIHYSGVLLDWLIAHHPEAIDLLAALVERDQVELLTGGYYEPILPSIPERDRQGQIQEYSNFLHQRFRTRPKGLWLTERVWEPHLTKSLAIAGIRYTVLDDTHFQYAGLTEDQLHGYYVTEEEGQTLNLLPIAKKLRYTIPFASPTKTIAYLREVAEQHPHAVAVYADDGEKFGSWPETHDLVWKKKWLERFIEEVSKHSSWLEVMPLGETLSRRPPMGRVYLPTASYAEMSEWSLPADSGRAYEDFLHWLKDSGQENQYGIFARGGFWRNFLVKYREANQMHKRMLSVSDKIERWSKSSTGDDSTITAALDHLYQGQCNCAYWHGVFGGLYLPHLRSAIWSHLMTADQMANEGLMEKDGYATATKEDVDADGRDEITFGNNHFLLCINTDKGGSIIEQDIYDRKINLIDGLTRQEEVYHRKLSQAVYKPAGEPIADDAVSIHDRVTAKEPDLQRHLQYDWYRRGSYIDHFFGDLADHMAFAGTEYPEQGDFVNQAYSARVETNSDHVRAVLRRHGGVWVGAEHVPVEIEKTFGAVAGSPLLHVSYRVTNCWEQELCIRFGIEFCVASQFGTPPMTGFRFDDRPDVFPLDARGATTPHRRFDLTDTERDIQVHIELDRRAVWWYFPLETISLSEDGFERTYQSTILCAVWELRLQPGETWTTVVTQYAGRIGGLPDNSTVGSDNPAT